MVRVSFVSESLSNFLFLFRCTGIGMVILATGFIGQQAYSADSPDSVTTHVLPTSNSLSPHRSRPEKDFRLHVLRVKTINSRSFKIPAHQIDFYSAAGSWVSASPEKSLTFPSRIPSKFHDLIQIFYGKVMNWVLVPKSWIFWHVSNSADGASTFEFVSPENINHNWIKVTISGACNSCSIGMVAGLIPDVSSAFKEDYKLFDDLPSPNEELYPKPKKLTNPTPCTALVEYSEGRAIIHGAVIMYTYKDGSAAAVNSLYVSLPVSEEALGNFIVRTYLETQTHRHSYFCFFAR